MIDNNHTPEYGWKSNEATCAHDYILPAIIKSIDIWRLSSGIPPDKQLRLFDVGCGNGYTAHQLSRLGYLVSGCDASKEGINQALTLMPDSKFEVMSIYDDIASIFEVAEWDIVLSSEVIEHLYEPRKLIRNVLPLLKNNGLLIITTPYHGYLKNLVMALSGKMDRHFTVTWDGGHIKFWSYKTLSTLLREYGLTVSNFSGAGRFPYLWKSMVVSAKKN